ncbi:unnamed protein product, partial [Ectocarpus sp. 12 AP-2014]
KLHTHTRSSETEIDKVYEQVFNKQREEERKSNEDKEKKDGKEDSSWGSLSRPSSNSKKRKGPPSRDYPPAPFTLRRVSAKSGRSAYENVQKLEVLKYSRSKCADGNPVGGRGAGKVFGIDPKLVRDWETQEG